jgi:hypothetical protein
LSAGSTVFRVTEDEPALLGTTIRIMDNSEETGLVLNENRTYGSVMIGGLDGSISGSNSAYDSKSIPTTMREARRMRRTQEQINELLEQEKAKQTAARQEVINARMKVRVAVGTEMRVILWYFVVYVDIGADIVCCRCSIGSAIPA